MMDLAMHDHINELLGMAFARRFYLSNELFGGTPPIGLAKGSKEEKKKPSNNLVKVQRLVFFVSFSFVILCL